MTKKGVPEVPLACPSLTEKERRAVRKVLGGTSLSGGPNLLEFEGRFREFTGVSHAVATSSGTAALHLALLSSGVGPGDDVITSSFSFIAAGNAIVQTGARPVFADIDPQTWCVDANSVAARITRRTKAIVAVHPFGNPCDMEALQNVTLGWGLPLIEDACEALGGRYRGKAVGSIGEAGVFAFYPNKQITTGEGGMLVTSSERLAAEARSLRSQGRSEGGSQEFGRFGFSYRMDEMSAALGAAQMSRIEDILRKRKALADSYHTGLAKIAKVRMQKPTAGTEPSWMNIAVLLDESIDRDRVIESLGAKGVASRPYFPAIHLQKPYRETYSQGKGSLPITEDVSRRSLALPFFTEMTKAQVNQVVRALSESISTQP
ncbi:MAG TPA: DegT/DnrJ/EryC1/StrS family aminotransferase [Thermoplasmata archaeon]|nr:DegT/DnrJ/EryC1/StrS family aminotransferase [Thermoplasmata archaeon]